MDWQNLDLSDYTPEDLAKAKTLPARWYTDPLFLEREKRKIFWNTWQPVCSRQMVARPGDFFTCEVAGEPLVLTRGQDDQLRGFFNVCRHRAGPVAVGKGNRKTLQCIYHGWTYSLAGQLLKTSEFEGVEDWSPEKFCLPQVRTEEWGPFVFVNLAADTPSFHEMFAEIIAQVEEAGFMIDEMVQVERRDYTVESNWKVYVDNYLEGYHIPIAHPGLYREIDYQQYRVDTYRYHSWQHAPFRPLQQGQIQGRDRRYLRTEEESEALYYWLFPNVMLNFYPDNLQINIVLPLDHRRTLTIFEWYFQQPGSGDGWQSLQESIAFSDEVQREDILLCEAVQKGLESQSYDQGRFSLKRENGVHHFQQLLCEFMR